MHDEKYDFKNIQEVFRKKHQIEEEDLLILNKISEFEKAHNKSKEEIQNQKRQELNRLNKEFLTNDYGRRFNITQNVIISAICGECNLIQENTRLNREQKVFFYFILQNYYDEIKSSKNYSILKNL